MDREAHLAGIHERAQIEAVLRSRRHPLGVNAQQPLDRLDEDTIGKLRQGEPSGRSAEADRMRVRTEYGDPSILLAVRLEALEDRLRVVEDRDPGIQLQRSIGTKLSVMPAPLAVPADSNQVLGEKLPEAGIGQQPLPRRGRRSLGGRSGPEID